MKKITQIAVILFFSLFLSAYQSDKIDDWKVVTQKDGIVLLQQEIDCPNADIPFKFELLKLKNTSNKSVRVEFSYDLVKNGQLVPTDPSDVSVSVILRPGEELQGECSWSDDHNLSVFKAENSNSIRFDQLLVSSFNVQSL